MFKKTPKIPIRTSERSNEPANKFAGKYIIEIKNGDTLQQVALETIDKEEILQNRIPITIGCTTGVIKEIHQSPKIITKTKEVVSNIGEGAEIVTKATVTGIRSMFKGIVNVKENIVENLKEARNDYDKHAEEKKELKKQ